MEVGGNKQSYKIGKFKDDNEYVSDNEGGNFQAKLLKKCG